MIGIVFWLAPGTTHDERGEYLARKAVATIGTGAMQPVLNESLHTFRRFGERHGYDVVVGGEEAITDRAPAWCKVLLLQRLLDSYDYVLWIDADAIVLDESVDPASLLGEHHYQALVRYRWNDEEVACTGVWLLRRGQKAVAFLDAVWNGGAGYLQLHPWEQAAAMRLLGYSVDPDRFIAPTEWSEGTLWLDNEWDSIPAFTEQRRLVTCKIRHYAARIESCAPTTNAYGSSRYRSRHGQESSGSKVALPRIAGRLNALEPRLSTQARRIRTGPSSRGRQGGTRTGLRSRKTFDFERDMTRAAAPSTFSVATSGHDNLVSSTHHDHQTKLRVDATLTPTSDSGGVAIPQFLSRCCPARVGRRPTQRSGTSIVT